jgi:hypothetical protein
VDLSTGCSYTEVMWIYLQGVVIEKLCGSIYRVVIEKLSGSIYRVVIQKLCGSIYRV